MIRDLPCDTREISLPQVGETAFWWEKLLGVKRHAHQKPVGLQAALIEAVTEPGDVVVDPAAGSFSVMESALSVGRNFLGGDLEG